MDKGRQVTGTRLRGKERCGSRRLLVLGPAAWRCRTSFAAGRWRRCRLRARVDKSTHKVVMYTHTVVMSITMTVATRKIAHEAAQHKTCARVCRHAHTSSP